MSAPLTYEDMDLPFIVPGHAALPRFLVITVEGTAEQLPKRMKRALEFYGFEVTIKEPEADVTKEAYHAHTTSKSI